MPSQEESRKEWEKEIVDVQHSLTFPEELRSVQIIAKKLSSTPAPIPDFAHLMRGILGGVLLPAAFAIFWSDTPHKIWFGVGTLAAACYLGITAFRLKQKRN
jgi:hypothetical protein